MCSDSDCNEISSNPISAAQNEFKVGTLLLREQKLAAITREKRRENLDVGIAQLADDDVQLAAQILDGRFERRRLLSVTLALFGAFERRFARRSAALCV